MLTRKQLATIISSAMLFVVLLAFVLTPITSYADDNCLTPIECLEKTVATMQQEMSDLKNTLQTQQYEIRQLRRRNLNASQITSGTLNAARIPNLSANKITTGTLDTARIPYLSANKITTGQITAAANVKLNGHWLSGDGGNEGVYVANNGKVGIGTTSPNAQLQVAGGDIYMNSDSAKLRVGDNTYTYIADYGNGDSDKLQLHGSSGVIFTGGNVGIGTTTPTAKLDVAGNIAIPGGFIHYGNRGKIGNAKNFNPNNDLNGLWIEGSTSKRDGKSAGIFMNENTLNLWSPGNTDILKVYDEDNFNNPLFVINGGGNVGIGTTSPSAKLEVAGDIAIPGGFIHYGNRGKIGDAKNFNPNNDQKGLWIEGSNLGRNSESAGIFMNNDTISLWSPGNTDILKVYDEDNFNSPLFVINGSGNVGIGTTNPSAKLEVAGDIAIPGGFIHYGNRGKIGNAKNFNPNNDQNGLWIEGSTSGQGGKSAGIFMNNNTLNLWSPGNTNILKVYDEDNFDNPLFVINAGGKVGIGTASPSTSLEVAGGDIYMNSDSAKLRVGDGTLTYIADYGNSDSDKLQLHGSNGVIFTGGNVGIGTTTPTAKLEVVGETKVSSLSTTSNINMNGTSKIVFDSQVGKESYHSRIFWGRQSPGKNIDFGDNGLWITAGSSGDEGGLFFDEDRFIVFNSGDTDKTFAVYNEDNRKYHLVVDDGGKVGIGTESPQAMLDVQGTIRIGDWEIIDNGSLIFKKNGKIMVKFDTENTIILEK